MQNIEIKNFVRALIGMLSFCMPAGISRKPRLYCNLKISSVTGGPERFLHNLSSNHIVKNSFDICNWSLKNCSAALVFSASWGDSFTKLCRQHSIRSVLRVDGFYVPGDSIDGAYQHGIEFREWVNDRISRDIERFDHVIYQSNFSKNICDKYLYQRETDFSILHNGVNLSHFTPDAYESSDDMLKLVMLGKHYPKHLKLALDIFINVLRVKDAELLVIGPMRDGSESVKDFINENVNDQYILEHIICEGTVLFEDLPSALARSDIFLHVKVGDWCPNAVLEAMACGLPVVCPAWGGTQELVGEAGISVEGPPWDVDESLIQGMAKAVLTIQSDLSHYKRRAREHVKNYDISKVAKRYLDVLGCRD